MQENHLEIITGNVPKLDFGRPDSFRLMASQIKKDLPDLPEGQRTPNELEVMQMSAFATAFRKGHPQATNRMVMRAVQKKFKVKIIRDAK